MRQDQSKYYIEQNKINPKRLLPHFKSPDKRDWDSSQLRLIIRGKRSLFCKHLRQARIKKGISQSDLAFDMGVNQNYISRVECGKINISFDNLLTMAYYLDCYIALFDNSAFEKIKRN
jgi:ribosome-binding protein aMBF1 (putative translation factor)